MRRLRKSVTVATARTMTLGHQATECIGRLHTWKRAIRRPNPPGEADIWIQALMAPAFGLSVNGCLQGGLQLEHPIHTARRISWKLFSGRAGLGGDGAGHELHPLGMNDSYASSSSLDSTLSRYLRCVPATHCEGPSFVKQ